MKRTIPLLAVGTAATFALAACGGGGSSSPLGGSSTGGAPSGKAAADTIRVGAANFAESQILADVYAAALTAKGVKATTGDPIGARAVYIKALDQGSIDLVPEYAYSLLTYLNSKATQTAPDAIVAALKKELPSNQVVLDVSKAQDANSVTVTKATAKKWNLTSIADLAKHQSDVTFAAPPEFQTNQQGLPALKEKYGFTPKKFLALTGNAVPNALKNGQAQAANIFTTDPSIEANGFVTLTDPKHAFGSDSVIPLINKAKATTKVKQIINAVQAKLTTDNLAEMDKQVQVDHKDASTVAKQWVKDNGLS